jgi:hypothetical protein
MNNFYSLFILMFLILATGPLPGQNFPWNAFFGTEGAEFATDIRQTSDDGYIIASYGSIDNSGNFYVVKIDKYGSLEWERNISKDNYAERAYSAFETANGEMIVVGRATMLNRPWVVKLNSQGDTIWTSQWTNSLPQNSGLLARGTLLPDGRIVVITASGQLGLEPKMFIVSQAGQLLEEKQLNPIVLPGWYSGTFVSHVESTTDGGFILTGTAGGGSGSRAFLWKFDHNADSSWSVHFTQPGIWMRNAESVKQLSDGGYILAGFTSPNSEHSCAIRTDNLGNVLWFESYPDSIYTQATDVVEWIEGKFLVSEKRFSAIGGTFFQSALLTISPDGSLLSRDFIIASDSSTLITRMRNTSDGGFVMAGEINEFLVVNEQDLFVLKSDSLGNIADLFIDYVWPGDVNYDGTVNMDDLMILGVTAGATGPVRVDQSIGWYPHYVTDWSDTVVSGVNFKHADTDGNGIVEIHDTIAIVVNYGLTQGEPDLYQIPGSNQDLFILPDEVQFFDDFFVEIPIHLGSVQEPVNNLYGFRFSLAIDPSLIQPGSVSIDFSNGWIGELSSDFWSIRKSFIDQGITDFGVTRINHQPVSGYGQIGKLSFELAEYLPAGSELTLDLTFSGFMAYDYGLSPLELCSGTFQITIINTVTSLALQSETGKFTLAPNPSDGKLLVSGLVIGTELLVYDLNGRIVQKAIARSTNPIEVTIDRPGMYIAEMKGRNLSERKKIIIL